MALRTKFYVEIRKINDNKGASNKIVSKPFLNIPKHIKASKYASFKAWHMNLLPSKLSFRIPKHNLRIYSDYQILDSKCWGILFNKLTKFQI